MLDSKTAPTGQQTIAAFGGLSLSGTIVATGIFLDSAYIRIVGGSSGASNKVSPSSYQNAILRDPLSAITSATGDTLSTTISESLLTTILPYWTISDSHASSALDELCFAASGAVGQTIDWRYLGDGTLWIGVETWPSVSLPMGSDVIEQSPSGRRYIIGVETPTLIPGVNVSDLGANVVGVDHWIEPNMIRTWAWT